MQDEIDRRDFINNAAKVSLAAAVLPYSKLLDRDPKTLTLAAVGDCMITRPLIFLSARGISSAGENYSVG